MLPRIFQTLHKKDKMTIEMPDRVDNTEMVKDDSLRL